MSDKFNKLMTKTRKEMNKQQEVRQKTKEECAWIQTVDGGTVQVEPQIVRLSPQLRRQLQSGVGSVESKPICATPKVQLASLISVLDYCRFHQVPGHSDKERKLFDDKLLKKDIDGLCLLIHASHFLELDFLSDKLCEAVAQKISNSSPKEKNRILSYATEHAQPQLVEDWKNSMAPLQRRLMQKLSVKKKKEFEGQENVMKVKAEVEAPKCEDTSSVDDLVSFINGGDGDSKKGQTKKKKNHKKKKGQKAVPSVCLTAEPSSSTRDGSLPVEDVLDDGDYDPAWTEEIDREVEEFARRLNVPLRQIRPDRESVSRERRLVSWKFFDRAMMEEGLDHLQKDLLEMAAGGVLLLIKCGDHGLHTDIGLYVIHETCASFKILKQG